MRRHGALGTVLVTLSVVAALVPAATVHAGPGDPRQTTTEQPRPREVVTDPGSATWVTMVGERRAFVSDGASRLFTGDEWVFLVEGSPQTGIKVVVAERRIDDGHYSMDFDIAAPYGETLQEGHYTDAVNTTGTSHPVLEVSGAGSGCNTATGSFTVRDLPADLSRLWVTYDFRCGGGRPAVTGEIRLNQPAGPGFDVAPSRLEWPSEPVGQRGRLVPMTVLNRANRTLTVEDVAIDQPSDDFRIGYSTCRAVAPGGFCVVYVQFRPGAPGQRTAALDVQTDLGARSVPLSGAASLARSTVAPRHHAPARPGRATGAQPGAGPGGTTLWRMVSEPGTWVGAGQRYWLDADPHFAHGHDTYAEIHVKTPSDHFVAGFAPDEDQLLLPGTTVQPVSSPGSSPATVGGLDVHGNGRGCGSRWRGWFTVHQAGYDLSGRLTRLAVTFAQACGDDTGWLKGSIAWRALGRVPDVPGYPDLTPPPPPARLDSHLTLRATPSRPTLGRRVLIQGRMRLERGKWPGGYVQIETRTPRSRAWRRTRQVYARFGSGEFEFRTIVRSPVTYRARFPGSAKVDPATAWLRVRPRR